MKRPAVLITGGARRLGAAMAEAFGSAGWHVIIHHRSSLEEATRLAASLPSAETVQCDLADPAAAKAMINGLCNRIEDWRVLINNASIFYPDTAQQLDPRLAIEALQVNAIAPCLLAQTYLSGARAADSRIVIQVTDQKLANPNPDFFSYTMSKHALHASISMLSMGAAQPADRIYGLAPGAILPSHDQEEGEAEISHRLNLLERRTRPDEVASAALFLAKGYLRSGETLFVDSGQHLLSQPRDVIYLARLMSSNQLVAP